MMIITRNQNGVMIEIIIQYQGEMIEIIIQDQEEMIAIIIRDQDGEMMMEIVALIREDVTMKKNALNLTSASSSIEMPRASSLRSKNQN